MRLALVTVSAFVLSALVGCAGSTTEEAGGQSNDALTSGAAAAAACPKFDEALAHYKNAVASAKAAAAKQSCENDPSGGSLNGTIAYTSLEAANAVATCADFKNVISTSPYAQPIRNQLAGNLSLPYLTGKVDGTTLAGLETALVGNTVWGPGAGVYPNQTKVAFRANGQALFSKLDTETLPNQPLWVDQLGTWSLANDAGKTKLTLTVDGKTKVYDVTLLDPKAAVGVDFDIRVSDDDFLTSLPSECEA